MKKTYLPFGARTNRWNSAPGTAYKSDAKTEAQLKKEREDREAEVKSAEDAYEAFEVKGPADLTKKLDLQKKYFELKGADEVKNYEEKMQTIADSQEEAKSATEANYKSLEKKHDNLQNGFDALQTRIKADGLAQRTTIAAPESKSFNEMLADGLVENAGEIKNLKKGQSVNFEMKAVADMTFPVNFSTARTSVAYTDPRIIELPKRKVHVRELLTMGGMDNNSTYNFVKEVTGDYLGVPAGSGPAPVAEAALKPQFDVKLVEAAVTAQWVAGWLRISRNMLDDVKGMTSFLQSRLPELLLRAEDNQLLNGTGTSPQISGITTAGNFTAAPTSSTYPVDVEQLVYTISAMEESDREATGILLNPKDWYRIWLTKASGSGEYDLPMNLVARVNGQMYIAGVPIFRSTAIPSDKFIVGDWKTGAQMILREPPRVEFFYEDGINVRENMVTVRVEERIAFPIYGDNYFYYGDFGNS